jgi:hypothetical protein
MPRKDKPRKLLPPMVDPDENEWERLEPGVRTTTCSLGADIYVENEYDRLLDVQHERAYENVDCTITR